MAAPAFNPSVPEVSSNIIEAQTSSRTIRREERSERRAERRENRQERRAERREDRRENRLERRGNNYYYNGRRGYRERRAGYRQHNGWWFPPAAFALGVIVGGSQPAVRISSAHVQWCHDRWRSYRVSDNSYQPYNGPRRICVSPYS